MSYGFTQKAKEVPIANDVKLENISFEVVYGF
jgi:hypothetical protein